MSPRACSALWTRGRVLGLVLLLGMAVRLGLLLQWPRRLSADETIPGLMGFHILRGEFPIFWYEQPYQGAAGAYLTAVVYALAGVSALASKVSVFLVSCALLPVTFLVGRRMAGWRGGFVCALFVALAPPFLPLQGNYPMLGYMEVVVVGSLVLLLTLDLVTAEPGRPPAGRKLLGLGFLAGFGWWINPMILSYLAAAGVFLGLGIRSWLSRRTWALPLGFVLGSLPAWVFNLTHAFWSFALARRGTEGDVGAGLQRASGLILQIAGVRGVLTDPVPYLSALAGVLYLGLLAVVLVDLVGWRSRAEPEARARRRGLVLFLLLAGFHLAAFSLNRHAPFATARHLFPLYSALPVLTGIALLRLWRWSRLLAAATLGLLLLNNGLALAKTVQVYEGFRRADWWKPEPIAAFLEGEGLTRVYTPVWFSTRLVLETRERIVATDPTFERYPPYLRAVDGSTRVAWMLSTVRGPAPTAFAAALDGIGATYRRKDFGTFSVFYDLRPPFTEPLESLQPSGWRAEASPLGTDPTRAFDRDPDTAWLSGEAMRPGMWYRVDLGRIVSVAGLVVLPVRPLRGIPAGYRVELSRDGATWETLAAVPEFTVTLRWRLGQPRLDTTGTVVAEFVPRPARYVRVVQTGANPSEWWGIAELFVYGPGTGSARDGAETREALAEGARRERDGQWRLALAAYARAVRRDPELEGAHWRMVEVYDKAGLPIDGSDRERRAQVFERLGLWGKAAREYEIVLEDGAAEGEHSEVPTRLLDLYQRQGEGEKAARVERRLRDGYAPPARAEAAFGGAVRLLGYGLEPPEPRAGEELALAYYWEGIRRPAEDYTVFVHFVHEGKLHFLQDHEPLHGRYPTSRWRAGERIRERYRATLPPELPPGEYAIRVGLWNPRTGKRLPVETALPHSRDQVHLTTLRVLPPR